MIFLFLFLFFFRFVIKQSGIVFFCFLLYYTFIWSEKAQSRERCFWFIFIFCGQEQVKGFLLQSTVQNPFWKDKKLPESRTFAISWFRKGDCAILSFLSGCNKDITRSSFVVLYFAGNPFNRARDACVFGRKKQNILQILICGEQEIVVHSVFVHFNRRICTLLPRKKALFPNLDRQINFALLGNRG